MPASLRHRPFYACIRNTLLNPLRSLRERMITRPHLRPRLGFSELNKRPMGIWFVAYILLKDDEVPVCRIFAKLLSFPDRECMIIFVRLFDKIENRSRSQDPDLQRIEGIRAWNPINSEMNYVSTMLKTPGRWLQFKRGDPIAERGSFTQVRHPGAPAAASNAADERAIKEDRPEWNAVTRPAHDQAPFEDDVFVGSAARLVTADLTKFHASERVQVETMREERRRFARDIHDGILQALTGAAMQLEAASQLIEADPRAARACVQGVCDLIAAEQRELRLLIRKTGPAAQNSSVSISELAAVLEKVRDRIGQQWALCIELTIGGHGQVPRALSDEIYSVVQEALANVARHAHAHHARVSLVLLEHRVSITVTDDGGGFPFRGRFDLPALNARGIGPVSLRERIAANRGSLILISNLAGSKLEISLPLSPDFCR